MRSFRELNNYLVKKGLHKGVFVFFLLIVFASAVLAQTEIEYDPYAPTLKDSEALEPSEIQRRERNILVARILEQPFRPVGYILGETAEGIERSHTPDKLIWFFDELTSHGIHPEIRTPSNGSLGAIGLGARIQLDQLFNIEQPFAVVNLTGGWTPNQGYAGSTVDFGGNYKIEASTKPIYHKGLFQYRRSSAENFYGIGQDASRGEWSTYQPEEIWLEESIGYDLTDLTELIGSVVYQRMNIGNGNRERVGKMKEHFRTGIPGISGGDLIGLTSKWMHDTRDHKSDPKKGGYQDLEFSYFHDTDGKNFQYLKMAGSAAHFISIFSDRRVLALRLSAEKNQELAGDDIPFYNLARLGGASVRKGSELLRSYSFNRYFDEGVVVANVEYRYNIYEYGDVAGDAVALVDVGEVFEEFSDLAFDELRLSYGGGLNLKHRRKTFLSIIFARGSEGWNASTHTSISF